MSAHKNISIIASIVFLTLAFSPSALAAEKKTKPSKADEEIKAALAKVYPDAKACYDAEAKNVKGLEGRIIFKLRINKDPVIEEATIEKDELGSAKVAACIVTKLVQVKLPPAARSKTISHSFIFSPTRNLAVLPFDNVTGDKSLDWLRNGMAISLMTKLGQISSVVLVERTKLDSILNEQALGQTGVIDERTAVKTGKLAGAQLIIIGAVQKAGKNLKFDARVVEVETGKVRRTVEAKGKLDEVFVLQDRLAEKICDAMNIMPTPETDQATALRVASSVAMFELISKAANALEGIGEPRDMKKAEVLFRQVIQNDPKIPEGYFGLAVALFESGYKEHKPEIMDLLKKAIDLRPNDFNIKTVLGGVYMFEKQFSIAFEYLNGALALKPDCAHCTYTLAVAYDNSSKPDEATILCKRAAELDPLSSVILADCGEMIALLGDVPLALKYTSAAVKLSNPREQDYIAHAEVQLMSNDTEGCLQSLAKGRSIRTKTFRPQMVKYSALTEAACLLKKGEINLAKAAFETAYSNDSKSKQELIDGKPWPKEIVGVSARWMDWMESNLRDILVPLRAQPKAK